MQLNMVKKVKLPRNPDCLYQETSVDTRLCQPNILERRELDHQTKLFETSCERYARFRLVSRQKVRLKLHPWHESWRSCPSNSKYFSLPPAAGIRFNFTLSAVEKVLKLLLFLCPSADHTFDCIFKSSRHGPHRPRYPTRQVYVILVLRQTRWSYGP
jgi:hypothetical protein